MPKMLSAYLAMEHQAGSRLMFTLTVADNSSHFVISQYALQPDGAATLRQSFPLNDVPALVERLKSALQNSSAENDPQPAAQSIAATEQPLNRTLESQPGDTPGIRAAISTAITTGYEPGEPDPYDFGAAAHAARQQPEQPGQ